MILDYESFVRKVKSGDRFITVNGERERWKVLCFISEVDFYDRETNKIKIMGNFTSLNQGVNVKQEYQILYELYKTKNLLFILEERRFNVGDFFWYKDGPSIRKEKITNIRYDEFGILYYNGRSDKKCFATKKEVEDFFKLK